MKNTKIFPFERNQYYYGKLLSVDDFNLEQKYNCNKQRLNHMFLSGSGIVSGMYVVNVGEQTISVETGCAIDPFGREMVIDVPISKKLQLFDGFEQATARGENYIYLCIEYAEKPTDAVYNIAGNTGMSAGSEDCVFNKMTESYRLFLTNREPELNGIEADVLFQDIQRLYFRNGISIKMSIPKYVEVGKKAVVSVDVETTEKNFVAFSFRLNLNGLSYEKENSVTVHFDELLVEKAESYHLAYKLDPVATPGYEAAAVVEEGSFKVVVDQKTRETSSNQKYSVEIVDGDIRERLIADFYKTSMDTFIEKAHQKYIYLAKIYLLKAEEAYLIDKVINVPFKQYVMNQELLGSLNKVMMRDVRNLEQMVRQQEDGEGADSKKGKQNHSDIQITNGIYDMEFGLHGENGRKFFSPPIVHGLGLGYVTIILSQETRSNEVVFGNADIFQDNYVDADLAAQLDETTGSFIIGAKLKETVAKNSIRIQWTAIRKMADELDEKLDRRMNIKPGMLELYTRECAYLEVSFYNMDDKQITWNVKEGCGDVDETNVYTAPNEKGVYEIMAQSIAYPDVKASIFAIVRERE